MSAGSELTIEQSRAKLKEQFTKFAGDRYSEGWADLWKKGDFLPWDRLKPSPALDDTLTNGRDALGSPFIDEDGKRRRKRALVPGCGRGVDVLLIQSFGYDVIGLEVAPDALAACEKFATDNEAKYPVRNEQDGRGSRRYVQGDFYSDDWLEQAGLMKSDKFELIYDYTFFCAMNPAMRPAWAKRMSDLLAPNQFSNLICLEFPTTKSASVGGPPFASPPKAYLEHLSRPGEKIKYSEEGEVLVDPLSSISPGGLERLFHYHPPVAHEIGKDADGKVVDYISIWRHRY